MCQREHFSTHLAHEIRQQGATNQHTNYVFVPQVIILQNLSLSF